MPKSAHSIECATVEDHAAMKKQWQTNLEIDLLKSAWIRKDREQHGAHAAPPLSAAKGCTHTEKTTAAATGASQYEGKRDEQSEEESKVEARNSCLQRVFPRSLRGCPPHSNYPSIVDY
ncbi:uncharacterized protein PITG_10512 [Phytophthora infestans T30-4]|uniref:Uncharacterized protein n=1 Tax=Phytophthora infestans (strain T30-4) TaxID=403677 RepID=D0NFH5_PHYIT|nr:uncharacterized protein PITG_10512 [Phytophthora infestans T30-4]EEY56964.1 hypothetical protein PITG_10512 [Phytophthora infestans T30-4]|eukprot:XP_002902292.1 hypothetical protein PITG_10512 [Phytophthora infestans T30-4]